MAPATKQTIRICISLMYFFFISFVRSWRPRILRRNRAGGDRRVHFRFWPLVSSP
jgi:hypothetical protein